MWRSLKVVDVARVMGESVGAKPVWALVSWGTIVGGGGGGWSELCVALHGAWAKDAHAHDAHAPCGGKTGLPGPGNENVKLLR